jgi:hypothetical protein
MVILQKTALFLVLPSTIAAIPTYRDLFTSVINGIPLGSAESAERSDSAFIRNVDCLKTDMKPLRNNIGAEVSAVVCRSGDVLVKITPPGTTQPLYKWVEYRNFASGAKAAFADLIAPSVYASQDNPPMRDISQRRVSCTRFLGSGRLVLKVYRSDGGCNEEVVNTYTGLTESIRPSGSCGC